jgi:hypothetical protein
MDLQLYNATTGQVIEEWDALTNGMFCRTIVLNPGVGANQFKIRARSSFNSGGCTVVGAAITVQQAKR